jgi:hypothetical protein
LSLAKTRLERVRLPGLYYIYIYMGDVRSKTSFAEHLRMPILADGESANKGRNADTPVHDVATVQATRAELVFTKAPTSLAFVPDPLDGQLPRCKFM